MKLLGVHSRFHDTNFTYFDGEKLHYHKTERMFNVKHHKLPSFSEVLQCFQKTYPGTRVDDLCIVTGKANQISEQPNHTLLDHHYAHALSVEFIHGPMDVNVVIDGRGGDRSWSVFKDDKLIGGGHYATTGSIGFTMEYMAKVMNLPYEPAHDPAGKVMGLQSYGSVDEDLLGKFQALTFNNIGISRNESGLVALTKIPEHDDPLVWGRTYHERLQQIILELFSEYTNVTDKIGYSGGVALNVLWNTALRNKYPNLHLVPHCGDEGLSLGAIEYLRRKHNLPQLTLSDFPYSQEDECPELISDENIDLVAEKLAAGNIVAWYQGHGEIGPRALGHRSLLMDPRIPDGKDRMNTIKNREYYRPFGASILSEFKKEYFDLDYDNPYMLYVGHTQKDNLQAITHVDNTCRVQTVSGDGRFRKLLERFHDITGCPVLLNTSMNFSGYPLASTFKNAVELFPCPLVDVLAVGNKVYSK